MHSSKRRSGILAALVFAVALATPPSSGPASAGDAVDTTAATGATAAADSAIAPTMAGVAGASCWAGRRIVGECPSCWGIGLMICFMGIIMELQDLL
jgi:hypothetical protein